MKIARSATSRANAISCVTITIVMPSSARLFMTASTSPTSSGSSAEVGSSKRIALGCMASARAIATRCCWPPESWFGNAPSLSARPTRARRSRPRLRASSAFSPFTKIGPSTTFSSAVRCGNRLKRWNTIETFVRISTMLAFVRSTATPSTRMAPLSCFSSPLMQRRTVDFPEPEGPMIVTISPFAMLAEKPRMT